jgi:hypothetical protein
MPPVARNSGGPQGRQKTSQPMSDVPKASPQDAGGRDSVYGISV